MSAGHFNEFTTVRALCKACGWFRVLGYCGTKDQVRAVIRIEVDPDGCNLLRGRVLEFPNTSQPDDWPEGYRDLREESYCCGMFVIEHKFDPLLENRSCPRCRKVGML